MIDIRCVKCNRLLFKAEEWIGTIEIKCPKCGYSAGISIVIIHGEYKSFSEIDGNVIADKNIRKRYTNAFIKMFIEQQEMAIAQKLNIK